MPVLHAQTIAVAKDAAGKAVPLPPMVALQRQGPVVQVSITVEQNTGKGLTAQGKPIPAPQNGLALIDTGASNSCVDDEVAKKLGLPVIDQGFMISATHQKVPCNIYPVLIATPIVSLNVPRAMGAALGSQGLIAIIGRDVLQNCTLFYNGPAGQFTLSL
jgi:predicted aspartyl protease